MTAAKDEAVTAREGAWHQSALETLLRGCSWQYGLTNVLHLPTTPKPASEAGSAAHAAFEAHELARKLWYDSDGAEGKEDGITQDEANSIAAAYLEPVVPKILPHHYPLVAKGTKRERRMEAGDVLDMAHHAIDAWYNSPTIDGGIPHREYIRMLRPKVLEPYFKADFVRGTMPIAGWADAVYEYGDGRLLIVDWKTAKDFSRWKKGDKRLQATLYSVALVLSNEYEVDDLRDVDFLYGVARTNVSAHKSESQRAKYERALRLQIIPELSDVEHLRDMVLQAQEIHDTDGYVRNPGWGPLCSELYCPFFEPCMKTGEYSRPFFELRTMFPRV